MQPQLRHKFFKNLFATWLILSIIIGSIVYYLETEQMDDWIVAMALSETKNFVDNSIADRDLKQQPKDFLLVRMEEITRHNFIIAELYDRTGEKYIEVVRPDSDIIEEYLKIKGHTIPTGREIWYEKHRIRDGIFLQVFVPIFSNANEYIGNFEGVYRVDEKMLATIERQVALSLVMVVIIVLMITVALYPIFLALNRDLIRYSQGLLKANLEVLDVLGGAIAKRDSDTHSHNYRVTIYAIYLAEALRVSPTQISELIKGAFLHDVGKIAISDTILLKNGKLSDEEFAIMKTHTVHGIDIIKRSSWLAAAMDVVRYHHEKYNGSGYMEGLQGKEIPFGARVFAIVDVFDALTSDRPYKVAFTLDKTVEIMRESEGTHFDSELLQVFLQIASELHSKFSKASDEILEQELGVLIRRYF